jgi:hypothetical protein
MSTLLTIFGVAACVLLLTRGYMVSMVLGAVVGSFFGIAGFGGAVSGAVPGALLGALIAKALR